MKRFMIQSSKTKIKAELFQLRRFSVRPPSDDDLAAAQAFFHRGGKERGEIGILLIHGFTVTPACFYAYGRTLVQAGYTVSVPLLPGHGTVPAALMDVTCADWLASVQKSYDALKKECQKVFVIGLSLGGALGLQLAVSRPDIAKLFLLSPAVYPNLPLRLLLPVMQVLPLTYIFHVTGDVKDPKGYEVGYRKVAINGVKQLAACMAQTQQILPLVKTDTLIFQARIDHEIPAEKAQQIFDLLGSDKKELIWLDDSRHAISVDLNAGQVLQRIMQDISKLV